MQKEEGGIAAGANGEPFVTQIARVKPGRVSALANAAQAKEKEKKRIPGSSSPSGRRRESDCLGLLLSFVFGFLQFFLSLFVFSFLSIDRN